MRKPGRQEKEFIHGFLDSLSEVGGAGHRARARLLKTLTELRKFTRIEFHSRQFAQFASKPFQVVRVFRDCNLLKSAEQAAVLVLVY